MTVDSGSIHVHVVSSEEDVELETAGQLVAWLTAHRPGALEEPTSGVVDKLKGGKFFKWE